MRAGAIICGKSGGFVLIYVAAILIFLTALVLHSSREVRGNAQVSARLQEHSAGRERLIAAATLLQARLGLLWTRAEPAERAMALFLDQTPGAIDVDGVNISATFQDADLKPDINQFSVAEWARLLGAYGMVEPEAQHLAERIDALRLASGGFESVVELANSANLPANLLRGMDTAGGEAYPALADLATAGGGNRRLHIANSPLALFLAFNAAREQIERLRELRRLREPTLSDGRAIFGGEVVKLIYAGRPERLRASLEIDGIPLRLEFELSTRSGQLTVTPPRIWTTA